jgi:site-specific DNA-methyltransferase (adenine-specific)
MGEARQGQTQKGIYLMDNLMIPAEAEKYVYYREKDIVLLHGDCLEILPLFTVKSIDLVMTSPPYDNLRDYGGDYTFDFKGIADNLSLCLSDGGVIVWVVGDATINGSETGTSFKQALYFKDECGLNLHDTMIYQVHGTGAKGSNNCYWQVFEYMFVFANGKIRVVNKIKDKKNKKYGSKSTSNKQHRDGVKTRLHPKGGTITQEYGYRDNVWIITNGNATGEYTGHPAPFPMSLAADHIKTWSNPTDTVLDPFLGSGTTAVAAKQLGRKCIGIELEKKYLDIAVERLRQEVLF